MSSDLNGEQNIEQLRARIAAQQKTIEVLMDAVERYAAEGTSSLALFSENLNLERVVQRKTESLRRQGKKLEEALRDLQLTQAQLLQANKLESVGRLAAGIAHEINTPIQFIGTNVDFLKDAFNDIDHLVESVSDQLDAPERGTSPVQVGQSIRELLNEMEWEYLKEEIPAAIGQCREGVKRISVIVQAMKEFSHPSGKEMTEDDINRIIKTTITVASNEWKYCADVRTDLDPELPRVSCLRDELGQVLLIILVNGAHAIEEKMKTSGTEKKGTITISTRRNGRYAEIRIADTGCGMPPDVREKIFEPFFTTKEVGKGTGQGLAIAHDVIVKKHGGTLNVTSEQGQGTEFVVQLPLERSAATA